MFWAFLTPILLLGGTLYLGRSFRCEMARLRRNRFQPFIVSLFSFKNSLRLFVALQVLDAACLITVPLLFPSPRGTMQPAVLFFGLFGTAFVSLALVMFGYLEVLFRAMSNLRTRGLLRDMELADVPPQGILLPCMLHWIALACGCAVLKGAAVTWFMFDQVPIAALALLPIRQAALAWMWMTYLFCAGIHGYGAWRLTAMAIWVIFIPEIIIGPVQMAAYELKGNWFPVLWSIQILIFGWLGSIFYISFLRAAPDQLPEAALAST